MLLKFMAERLVGSTLPKWIMLYSLTSPVIQANMYDVLEEQPEVLEERGRHLRLWLVSRFLLQGGS